MKLLYLILFLMCLSEVIAHSFSRRDTVLVTCQSDSGVAGESGSWNTYCMKYGATCVMTTGKTTNTPECKCPTGSGTFTKQTSCQATCQSDSGVAGETGSWDTYCTKYGAACEMTTSNTPNTPECKCPTGSAAIFVAKTQCQDPCELDKIPGVNWRTYCTIIGAACMVENNSPVCDCGLNKVFLNGQCSDPCLIEKSPGDLWAVHCVQQGGTCVSVDTIPTCKCPSGMEFKEDTCQESDTCTDIHKHGITWNNYCKIIGGTCKRNKDQRWCDCGPNKVFQRDICLDPCMSANDNGKLWVVVCAEEGVSCFNDGTKAVCDIEGDCDSVHPNGLQSSWNNYCRMFGARCHMTKGKFRNTPVCKCPSGEEFISKQQCPVSCQTERTFGDSWDNYCTMFGASCEMTGQDWPICKCPNNSVFVDGEKCPWSGETEKKLIGKSSWIYHFRTN